MYKVIFSKPLELCRRKRLFPIYVATAICALFTVYYYASVTPTKNTVSHMSTQEKPRIIWNKQFYADNIQTSASNSASAQSVLPAAKTSASASSKPVPTSETASSESAKAAGRSKSESSLFVRETTSKKAASLFVHATATLKSASSDSAIAAATSKSASSQSEQSTASSETASSKFVQAKATSQFASSLSVKEPATSKAASSQSSKAAATSETASSQSSKAAATSETASSQSVQTKATSHIASSQSAGATAKTGISELDDFLATHRYITGKLDDVKLDTGNEALQTGLKNDLPAFRPDLQTTRPTYNDSKYDPKTYRARVKHISLTNIKNGLNPTSARVKNDVNALTDVKNGSTNTTVPAINTKTLHRKPRISMGNGTHNLHAVRSYPDAHADISNYSEALQHARSIESLQAACDQDQSTKDQAANISNISTAVGNITVGNTTIGNTSIGNTSIGNMTTTTSIRNMTTSTSIRNIATTNIVWTERMEENFFVAAEQGLVYCAVEKVGSSLWKRVFRILNGKAPAGKVFAQSGISTHVGNDNFTFSGKNLTWKTHMLDRSLKFLFVRHPLARTFSAYMDKVFLPFGAKFVSVTNSTSSARGKGGVTCRLKAMTFPQFITTIVTSNISTLNTHFSPIHSHCKPCQIQYDIVGRLESLHQDADYILRQVGLSLSQVAMDSLVFDSGSDVSILTDLSHRTVISPVWRASKREECWVVRDELLRRLWMVLQVRGLLSANVSFPFTVAQSGQINTRLLLLALVRAYDQSGPKEDRLKQRDLAMKEAYATVPVEDLVKVAAFHKRDCDLFGYDCSLLTLLNYKQSYKAQNAFFNQWTYT